MGADVNQADPRLQEHERLDDGGRGALYRNLLIVAEGGRPEDKRYRVAARIAGLETQPVGVIFGRCFYRAVFMGGRPVMVLRMLVTGVDVRVKGRQMPAE